MGDSKRMVGGMATVLRALWGLGRSFPVVVSVALSFVGAVKLMGYDVPYLPYWGWWLMAIGILFIQLVRQQMTIDEQSDKLVDARPADLPMEDLLGRIVRQDHYMMAKYVDVEGALEAIREYAQRKNAAITIFGERALDEHRALFGKPPVIDIDHAYWRDHKIVIKGEVDEKGMPILETKTWTITTEPMGVSTNMVYENLKVCSAQVDRIWPRPKKRLRVQAPWRIEKRYP